MFIPLSVHVIYNMTQKINPIGNIKYGPEGRETKKISKTIVIRQSRKLS